MKKTVPILTILIIFTLWAKGQSSSENLTEKGILFKYEKTGGVLVHTTGFGLNYRQEKHITGYKKSVLEFEFTGIKHPKEVKSINPLYSDAKSYIYGKQNTFSVLRLGIGIQKVINSKSRAIKSAIELRSHINLGFSAGFTKPVYLYIIEYSNYDNQLLVEKYDPNRHYIDNIYGRAPFTKGFSEINFHPGAYGKFGISVDYAPEDEIVKSLEMGTCIDVFPKRIPIMAYNKNKNLFLSFYLSFNIGYRYN